MSDLIPYIAAGLLVAAFGAACAAAGYLAARWQDRGSRVLPRPRALAIIAAEARDWLTRPDRADGPTPAGFGQLTVGTAHDSRERAPLADARDERSGRLPVADESAAAPDLVAPVPGAAALVPLYSARHDAALPRRQPIDGRQPWQPVAPPTRTDMTALRPFAGLVYGEAPQAAVEAQATFAHVDGHCEEVPAQ